MDSMKLALTLVLGLALVGCDDGTTTPTDAGTDAALPPGHTFPSRAAVCDPPPADTSTPCATDTPAQTDAERTHEAPTTMPDETLTYLVSVITIPQATPDPDGDGPMRGLAPGFNLDGIDSQLGSVAGDATCEEFNPDFEALQDQGLIGVDNALQGLIVTIEGILSIDIDATLAEQIADGSLLLMMEVRGVNDFNYDSDVQLQLYLGELAAGATLEIGGDGQVAPGQTFETSMMLGAAVDGDIFDGRLRAATDLLTIPIETEDFSLPLMISSAEVRFDISETGLVNGTIGGVLTVQSLVDATGALAPGMEGTVYGIVSGLADVNPCDMAGECMDPEDMPVMDPAVCGSLSVGLTFGATTATRNP